MEYLKELNSFSVLIRLVIAIICGGVVGLERGQKNRPAGFRTYMLVSMGSALVMIVSQYISVMYGNTDITRMGAQVISGIGFLGAGTIIVTSKMKVKGLTTAAGLWTVACMGIAIGIGYYSAAIISCILIFILLSVFRVVETKIGQKSKQMNVYLELSNVNCLGDILREIKANNSKVLNIEITRETDKIGKVIILLEILNQKNKYHNEMIELIGTREGVLHLEEY
jgi:putative Mg2+ transporter-C (MgtC) family protein